MILSGFQVKEFILTIATCVTITSDLERWGPVMVYVLQQPDKSKSHVDNDVTFSFKVTRECMCEGQ